MNMNTTDPKCVGYPHCNGWASREHVPSCSLFVPIPGGSVNAVECPDCKQSNGAVNHVVGHIFVGWGHGWQPCIHCNGTGKRVVVEPHVPSRDLVFIPR